MKNYIEKLSVVEEAILRMMVGEMTDNEIAFALDINEETLKSHIKNIFEKLNVSNRTAATTLAIKSGLGRIDV
jgi:DNA-binding CsgD family transcriptional regulator